VFTVTKEAAKELKRSMAHHDFDDMPLRIAARKSEDGSFEYQMGFDEAGPGDAMFGCNGIDVIIAKEHKALLNGTRLEYVELDDGEMHFIFLNPNDPTYVPPADEDSGAAS
jgi:iron-sulfur cluster assembly protein